MVLTNHLTIHLYALKIKPSTPSKMKSLSFFFSFPFLSMVGRRTPPHPTSPTSWNILVSLNISHLLIKIIRISNGRICVAAKFNQTIFFCTCCRGYYRCSHRHAQGCLATKQVQKSDEDPSIVEVTYRGRHTCIQASYAAPPSAAAGAKEEPVKKEVRYEPQPLPPPQGSEKISNFGSGLKVKTEELESGEKIFRSFSFSFPESETVEKILEESMIKSSLMGSFSPAFMSPTISESNYFSLSPCLGMGNSVVYSPESELTENISGTTSITNSPMGYYNFSLDPVDFDPNFPFDNPEYFQ